MTERERLPLSSSSRRVVGLALGACVMLAAAQAAGARHNVNPDGISYLELAQRVADGRLPEAVSAY